MTYKICSPLAFSGIIAYSRDVRYQKYQLEKLLPLTFTESSLVILRTGTAVAEGSMQVKLLS
jgi:hypothetical protein